MRCVVGDGDADSYAGGSAYCGLGTECGDSFVDSCSTTVTYFDAGKPATLDCVGTMMTRAAAGGSDQFGASRWLLFNGACPG